MLSSLTARLVRNTLHLSLTLCALLGLSGIALGAPPARLKAKAPTQPAVKVAVKKAVVKEVVEDGRIDINTATADQLMTLKGIGKKRAEAIVKDRETNGPFSSPMDLTRVKGIGKKTVENNTQKIKMGNSAPAGLDEHPNPNPSIKKP